MPPDEGTASNRTARSALDMLDRLYNEQIEWTNTLYKSANDRLLSLLGECIDAFNLLKADPTARKVLDARLKEIKLDPRAGTHLATKVVRYVFRLSNGRASAYARVLRVAIDSKVEPLKLGAWVAAEGGIEAVRRAPKGVNAKELAKQTAASAEEVLATAKALLTIAKLPASLKAGTEAVATFSLLLVRNDQQTGAGDVVWGTDNAALTKRFLALVGKKVLETHAKRAAIATTKRAARKAAATATSSLPGRQAA